MILAKLVSFCFDKIAAGKIDFFVIFCRHCSLSMIHSNPKRLCLGYLASNCKNYELATMELIVTVKLLYFKH